VPIEEKAAFSIAAPCFLDNGTAFWVLQADCPKWVCPEGPSIPHRCPGTCGTVIRY
jgi:hypothetical protein